MISFFFNKLADNQHNFDIQESSRMLCTQVEPSCQGNELSECWSSLEIALHWSDILQLYPIRLNMLNSSDYARQTPTFSNSHQLPAHTDPTVGECWRLSGQCGSCCFFVVLLLLLFFCLL